LSNARFILVALICASPAIMLLDGPILQGLVAGVTAAGIAIVGRTMRAGETEFTISIVARLLAFAALPALWMLVQILPFRAVAHPIWGSAEAALGHPLAGSISVDTGDTIMALGQYLTIVAVALLSAAVAVQRQRAEWILFSLTGASALMALILITHDLFRLGFLAAEAASFERSQVVDCITLGTIISAAAAIRTIERLETRKTHPERSVPVLLLTFAASGATLAICLAALMLGERGGALVAAAYGLLVLASVVAIRRLGLGPWGMAGLATAASSVAILSVVLQPALGTKSLLLVFASSPTPVAVAAQRALDDAPLTGVGAGAFAAIAPIYRQAGDAEASLTAPTTAAAVDIELGGPMLWLIIAAVAAGTLTLLQASLRRGRDSFYTAAGGGCLTTVLALSFVNAGLLGTATAIIIAATVGLAFAQSKGRLAQH
jgi:hypothetical protein